MDDSRPPAGRLLHAAHSRAPRALGGGRNRPRPPRDRGVLARGGPNARPGRGLPAGRSDLPHGRLHRPAQGELIALRWRDVDFLGSAIRVCASYTNGHVTTPKSGTVRSVPMAPTVAEELARLGQRDSLTDEDDQAESSRPTQLRARSRSGRWTKPSVLHWRYGGAPGGTRPASRRGAGRVAHGES